MLEVILPWSLCLILVVALFFERRRADRAEGRREELLSQSVRLEAENQSLRQSLESEKALLERAKEQLQDSFKSLAAAALESSNRQFLELAKGSLEKEAQAAKSDLDKRQTAIQELLKPLASALDRYQNQASEIERERQKSYSLVEAELKRVVEASSQLSQETSALKNALKKPHVRGRWGEVQLRNCVELAGMSEFADVSFQDQSQDSEGQRLIPDMTVRMPGGRIVVVDAKTPVEAFLGSLEATSDEQRGGEMLRHGRHVKEHIRKLSSRGYAEALKDSADFTVMFLPNESFLYAALEVEPDLVEYALNRKVLVATPPTLIGLLKVIRFGWNEEKLADNAQKISEAGQELHKRLCDFVDAYMNVGKHLARAKEEYDTGLGRLEKRVLVQARRMESLGVLSNKSLPEGMGEEGLT